MTEYELDSREHWREIAAQRLVMINELHDQIYDLHLALKGKSSMDVLLTDSLGVTHTKTIPAQRAFPDYILWNKDLYLRVNSSVTSNVYSQARWRLVIIKDDDDA